LNHDQADERFEPFTAWVPAIYFDGAQSLLMIRDNVGTLQVATAYQVATCDPNEPSSGTPNGIGSYRSTAGRYTESATGTGFTNNVNPVFWIRFGVLMRADYGPAQAEITLSIVGLD
jgi:hypothetical protein